MTQVSLDHQRRCSREGDDGGLSRIPARKLKERGSSWQRGRLLKALAGNDAWGKKSGLLLGAVFQNHAEFSGCRQTGGSQVSSTRASHLPAASHHGCVPSAGGGKPEPRVKMHARRRRCAAVGEVLARSCAWRIKRTEPPSVCRDFQTYVPPKAEKKPADGTPWAVIQGHIVTCSPGPRGFCLGE